MTGRFHQAHSRSLANPNEFWAEAAERVHWFRRWDRVLDDSRAPIYRWFTGAEVNTCYNAVDRHVEGGRKDQLALIWDSPVSGSRRTLTYGALRDEVAVFAGALRKLGIE